MKAASVVLASFFLVTFSEPASQLDRILASGELRVVTRYSPTTYYVGRDGPTGLEYLLVEKFAERLGVRAKVYTLDSFSDVIPEIAEGRADIGAAGLTVTSARSEQLRFGPAYQEVAQNVIYRYGTGRPRSLEQLDGGRLEVVAGSSHAERLRELTDEYPELTWVENPVGDIDELLRRVANGEIDYTIADGNDFELGRYFYPDIRVAFEIQEPRPLAWALRRIRDDNSLADAVGAFFEELKANGEIEQLVERFYGHVDDFDYVGTRQFLRDMKSRLPDYQELFFEAEQITGINWRLLAAVGYQESHWKPGAVSPTGVRGIMMLTQSTAQHLGVKDRLDPRQSIIGGARYLKRVKRKVPKRIPEPDRTWMTLAAYNVGYGHLEDARVITERNGMNPDRWFDVRKHLPLLAQKKWYSQTKRGYARGWEPVLFVDNVRSYYDILRWLAPDDGESFIEAATETAGSAPVSSAM